MAENKLADYSHQFLKDSVLLIYILKIFIVQTLHQAFLHPAAVQSNIPNSDMKYNSIKERFVIGDNTNPMHEPANSVKQTQKTHH